MVTGHHRRGARGQSWAQRRGIARANHGDCVLSHAEMHADARGKRASSGRGAKETGGGQSGEGGRPPRAMADRMTRKLASA